MLSLIKIRAKYLSRHKCGVYCSCCFIPTLILIVIALGVGIGIRMGSYDYDRYYGEVLKTNLNLFEQDLKYREQAVPFYVDLSEEDKASPDLPCREGRRYF